MSNVRRARRLAGAVLVVAATSGCTQANLTSLTCDPTLAATGEAFQGAMTALVTTSQAMREQLSVACTAIATDLGSPPPASDAGAAVTDASMTAACNAAAAAIKAAGTSVPVIEGGKCQVDAQAQFTCESQCDVTHVCTPPTVVARCSPAELSGVCSGECQAMAVCEGSATVSAKCQGTCAASCTGSCTGGTCSGTCDGAATTTPSTCSGTCDGECTGTCTGTCNGDCTLAAGASINCGAEATCRGGCSVAYTAPVCEAALTPPSCNIDANCEAACTGQGSLQATCTAPTVVLVSASNPMLKTTLETNLPAILNVLAQSKLVAQAAVAVSGAAQNVGNELSNQAACALTFGVEFATQVTASVAASTTISVSVQASVSVSSAAVGG